MQYWRRCEICIVDLLQRWQLVKWNPFFLCLGHLQSLTVLILEPTALRNPEIWNNKCTKSNCILELERTRGNALTPFYRTLQYYSYLKCSHCLPPPLNFNCFNGPSKPVRPLYNTTLTPSSSLGQICRISPNLASSNCVATVFQRGHLRFAHLLLHLSVHKMISSVSVKSVFLFP